MKKERIITGIDIGSVKITTIIASVSDEKISVMGVSTVPSKGIKKGVVVDIDQAVEAINECLEGSERMSGYAVSNCFVSLDGSHISSLNSHGVVAVSNPEGEITEEDVRRVTEAARAVSLPSSRELIHVIPRDFMVDSQNGVKDPVGMSGVRLEVETNIISGATTVMKNLVKCVQQVGVDVEDLVFAGIASAEAVLNDTEKELGCILADIGGGTTKLVIFSNGSPACASVLPVGGQNITNDLAIGLRTSLEAAENVKIKLATVKTGAEGQKDSEELDISELGLEIKSVPRKLLSDIINSRVYEIFSLIALEIKKSGYSGKLPAGIIVTGGVAETLGLAEACKRVLNIPFRIGYPTGVTGLIEEIEGPVYASAVGLIHYGSHLIPERNFPLVSGGKIKSLLDKFLRWLKSFLP